MYFVFINLFLLLFSYGIVFVLVYKNNYLAERFGLNVRNKKDDDSNDDNNGGNDLPTDLPILDLPPGVYILPPGAPDPSEKTVKHLS